MRLLHVISLTDPETGGPIEALLRISEVMVRDGHKVTVVSLEDGADVTKRNFPFEVIGLGRGTRKFSFNTHLTPWIEENAGKFDAVILHGLWNYASLGAWRALRRSSTPYYIFAHGMMDPWFRDRYRLKHFAKQAYWSVAQGRVLRDATSVLFTCEEERTRARGVFKGHPYREQVVLFGTADPGESVDEQRAAFLEAFPRLRDRKFLLFLSRIHPKKGCDLLLHAFADSLESLAGEMDLVIAGPDQVGWVSELQELAERLGISHRVHWPGMLKGEVKWGAFRQSEGFILPSHQENFGFVVAEAMACSTPVLISDKVNIWREVKASGCGLIQPDTLEGTRRLIQGFAALPQSQRMRMAENARAGFLKHFDVQVAARDFARAIGFEQDAA